MRNIRIIGFFKIVNIWLIDLFIQIVLGKKVFVGVLKNINILNKVFCFINGGGGGVIISKKYVNNFL